ncbi:MAG: DnaB-like helicase N-terminal domain-containing protein, partial [Dolichospermum sp.]
MQDTLRLPPCAIEAEETVLGGILLDPDAIDIVAVMLTPEDFYLDAHAKIYQIQLDLKGQNKPTDITFVTQRLSDLGILADVGGRNKIAQLIDCTVSAANIDALAELVLEKSTKRKLLKTGNMISQAALDSWVSADEAIQIGE